MSALWTSADAAAATGGQATGTWMATGVSIDTRTIRPGDLFVALKAARDGHVFVAQALEKGASAALVSHVPDGVDPDRCLLVDDVLQGLEKLGEAGRARTRARVAAITGSVGKTSTKEMLRAALAGQGRVHAAEASYNNHWGVPLTLARMPVDTDFAIIEIGMNHPGEIAPLSRMARPHVAMVTTVAAAHLEAFDDIDGIAREKAAICAGLTSGGVAVLHGDIDQTPILIAAARDAQARVVTFGQGAANPWHLQNVSVHDGVTVAEASADGADVLLRVRSPGTHFAVNGLGALAVADALGADLARSLIGLADWQPPAGRGTRETVTLDPVEENGTIELIDDAFNANPTSVAAALDTLSRSRPRDDVGRVQRGRRVVILGDMLELGPTEIDQHRALASHPDLLASSIVHCVGPRMRALHDALPEPLRGRWTETAEELATQAGRLVDPGDVVLVKGSKGSKVSLVVDAIRKLGHRPIEQDKGHA